MSYYQQALDVFNEVIAMEMELGKDHPQIQEAKLGAKQVKETMELEARHTAEKLQLRLQLGMPL